MRNTDKQTKISECLKSNSLSKDKQEILYILTIAVRHSFMITFAIWNRC